MKKRTLHEQWLLSVPMSELNAEQREHCVDGEPGFEHS